MRGDANRPRTTRAAIPYVSLLEEASEMVKTAASGSNGTTSVRSELVRDVWNVVAGFLKGDSMESLAGRRKDMCGILACRA